jgi:endonuclease III
MKPADRAEFFRRLRAALPHPRTELEYQSPFELLVAVILSAQATDVGVNKATHRLYAVANTPQAILELGTERLKDYIRTIGLFNTKAENIIKTCRLLVERHGGEVPRDRASLEALPGVGRKTANVVLGNAFGIPGITVDTHFGRLSRRFGWTTAEEPEKIEAEVGSLFPRSDWTDLSHRLIWHGRRVCHARTPACGACPLAQLCPSFGVGQVDPVKAAKLVKVGP